MSARIKLLKNILHNANICAKISTIIEAFEVFMKKIMILAACLLILSLTGCKLVDSVRDIFDGGITCGGPVQRGDSDYEGAIISYVDNDSRSVTVTIKNESLSTWQSGNMRSYSLETERDGVWYEVTPTGDLANTMELLIFAPGEEMTHTFDLYARYGELPEGHYRVVKSYWANKTAFKDATEFHLTCEFWVE